MTSARRSANATSAANSSAASPIPPTAGGMGAEKSAPPADGEGPTKWEGLFRVHTPCRLNKEPKTLTNNPIQKMRVW